MNTVIINILCEGQTEEGFVSKVLKPYFDDCGIVLKPRILLTSKKKNQRGGMISFSQAKRDIEHWISENRNRKSETHYYTTMFDFYALPSDFPGMDEIEKCIDAYGKVSVVERAMAEKFQVRDFIPYIQLHEFEALLLSDVSQIIAEFPTQERTITKLQKVLDGCNGNPELVNTGRTTAPSKRIVAVVEEGRKYEYYKKVQNGVNIACRIGIDVMMNKCNHFKEWIDKLIALTSC